MLVALCFTDLVAEIPSAALAGLVANAVVSVIDVRAFRTFARVRRSELLIALGCTAGVLVLGPIGGLVLAMLATMVDMVRRIAGSPWVTLEPPEGDWEMERFAAVADPDAVPVGAGRSQPSCGSPVRCSSPTPTRSGTGSSEAAAGDVRWVLLDFESVTDVDPTASEALADSVAVVRRTGQGHRHRPSVGTRATPARALRDHRDDRRRSPLRQQPGSPRRLPRRRACSAVAVQP